MGMNIVKAMTFLFKDREWASKTLVAVIVSYIPILNLAWIGYLSEITLNVSHQNTDPLPEWSDLGSKFLSGLKFFAAEILYSLPIILLLIIPLLGFFLGLLPEDETLQTYALGAYGLGVIVLICCFSIYFLLLSLFLPAAFINFSQKNTFKSCFEIKRIIQIISSNLGDYLLALVAVIAASFVIGFLISVISILFIWIICIGWILLFIIGAVTNVWIGAATAHLLGQVGYADMMSSPN
jgi:hypothetical protein